MLQCKQSEAPSMGQGNGKKNQSKKPNVVPCGGCGAPVTSNVPVNRCVHCASKDERYPKEK